MGLEEAEGGHGVKVIVKVSMNRHVVRRFEAEHSNTDKGSSTFRIDWEAVLTELENHVYSADTVTIDVETDPT
jgi:hypothetical protein